MTQPAAADSRGADIAIVGVGCRFPGGASSPSKLWDLLCDPKVVSSPLPFSKGFYHSNYKYHGHHNVTKGYFLDHDQDAQLHSRFDASFFGVSHTEASSFDPQLRMLLETIYEALERSGTPMEALRGSDTAVYVGQMLGDYELMMHGDPDAMATYHITGTGRSMTSSRVSYFYDWQGPSMTVDTACSSSITAVHHAILQLRSGHSRVAVAAAANLLLDVGWFVAMSNLKMLSPDGESRMWDSSANGYARGEGVAALVLKTREAAEADGDNIMCIIRGTALNQDGRTAGPTMPSAFAQAELIRDCYRQSGLDINEPTDRPQFFEAHGTGTPAGDPVEAEAISSAFFPAQSSHKDVALQKLLVGGVKTIVGHTEATAGMAGIIKACLAIQHGLIPPNLHFSQLNPKIAPFYKNLHLATELQPWPCVPQGSVRRASVNSFGFGGSNGHIILENYTPSQTLPPSMGSAGQTLYTPLVFSANTESALRASLSQFSDYIQDKDMEYAKNLAYTLSTRRSRLPVATFVVATSIENIVHQIQQKLEVSGKQNQSIGTRSTYLAPHRSGKPSVLAVFTGQGAQWPQMGLDLVESSPAARRIFESLQAKLNQLPLSDRPSWSLLDELRKPRETSCVHSATYSQPLCTAVQIVQVEILRAAGIALTAIVGHSSGEIAAAFAAGFISAEDAICIAYYRGVYGVYSQGTNGENGAMLAVGTSYDDATDLLQYGEFAGKACVAAVNSHTSVTLSGDVDAIQQLAIVFKDEGKFVRQLKVDRAYHSHHMSPCASYYLNALNGLNIEVEAGNQATWFSSVHGGPVSNHGQLSAQYWLDNMSKPVLFLNSLQDAREAMGSFNVVLEIGPHPALKGPVMETLQNMGDNQQLYLSLFKRGESSTTSISDCFGQLWTHYGSDLLNLHQYECFASEHTDYRLTDDIPSYAWDHDEEIWHESRYARRSNVRDVPVHELLGHLTPDSTTKDMRWRQILRISEVPWIGNHRLQGVPVFPATGYVVSILEASLTLTENDSASLIELLDVEIGSALVFERDDASIEVVVSLTDIARHEHAVTAKFSYFASTGKTHDILELKASGSVCVHLDEPCATTLPARQPLPFNMLSTNAEQYYQALSDLEYEYKGQFETLYNLKRKLGAVTGFVGKVEHSDLIIHPGALDTCLQPCMLAMSSMDDDECTAMHIPKRFRRLAINPMLCAQEKPNTAPFVVDVFNSNALHTPKYICDIDVYSEHNTHALIQTEGLEFIRISKRTEKDDEERFAEIIWTPLNPLDGITPSNSSMAYLLGLIENMVLINPQMTVVQLGNDQATTTNILEILKGRFKSYNAVVSTKEGQLVSQNESSSRVTVKPQGWFDSLAELAAEDKADLLICITSQDMSASRLELSKIRDAMKPGAQLVIAAVDVDFPSWSSSLEESGAFSDVRIVKGDTETGSPLPDFVTAQATDQSVDFLSNPLACNDMDIAAICTIENLLIVHGSDEFTTQLAQNISTQLQTIAPHISLVSTLDAVLPSTVVKSTAVLSLVDLVGSVFESMDGRTFEALKRTILASKQIIWVTHGKRADNPHANMISGLLLSASRDVSSIDYMMLDFEVQNMATSKTVANALLRHCASSRWHSDNSLQGILEREVMIDSSGMALVPRVLPSQEMNSRYNAGYRNIVSEADVADRRVCVSSTAGDSFTVDVDRAESRGASDVQTWQSLLSSVRISHFGYMSMQFAKQSLADQFVVALSAKNSSNIDTASAVMSNTNISTHDAAGYISLVAKCIAAIVCFEGLGEGDRVLVLEPERSFAAALQHEAAEMGIDVLFATTKQGAVTDGWLWLQPVSSARVLRETLGTDFQAFVQCAGEKTGLSRLCQAIRDMLPTNCREYNDEYLFGGETCELRPRYRNMAQKRLHHAMQQASVVFEQSKAAHLVQVEAVTLEDVTKVVSDTSTTKVINWSKTDSVPVHQQPATESVSFQPNKTYWLVGLSSSLGLSLCEWMAYRGARHIALSSRTPKIDSRWVEDMEKHGVEVRAFACDITSKTSLAELHEQICSTMPPIAGVTQGAMVLKDTAFDKMALEDFASVTRPKVEGSIYLNELFPENTLDFFIFFSSIASVMGNFGQVNYSAANAFMTSLAAQRRKRGLAASVMHIGPIFGVGYLTRSDAVSTMGSVAMQRSGFNRTSERQFHQLFAEAMLAGSPASKSPRFEVVSGISRSSLSKAPRDTLATCARVIHFQDAGRDERRLTESQSTKVPVKQQVETASDQKQIYNIVWNAMVEMLESDMHIKLSKVPKAEQSIMRFNQLGVDSLAAAEIRTWLMTEVGVRVPVLSILSGGAIGDLVSSISEDIFMSTTKAANSDDSQSERATGSSDVVLSSEDEGSHDSLAMRGSIDDTASSDSGDHIIKSVPLSFTQARFYPAGLFLEDRVGLNHTIWGEFLGKIEGNRLEKAVDAVIHEHEILRTAFFNLGDAQMQHVMEVGHNRLERVVIQDETEGVQIRDDLQKSYNYNVSRGETLRIMLLSTQDGTRNFLVFGLHPLVLDTSSFVTMINCISKHYAAPQMTSNVTQFSDISQKQRKDYEAGAFGRELQYWANEFATVPPVLPVLTLAKVDERPAISSYGNLRSTCKIDLQTKAVIAEICRSMEVTPSHFYMAVLRATLLQFSASGEDVTFVMAENGRGFDVETADVIGCLYNLVPTRLATTLASSFRNLVELARDKVYSGMANSRLPYTAILNDLGLKDKVKDDPVFQVFYDYRSGQRMKMPIAENLDLELTEIQFNVPYDVSLDIVDGTDEEGDHVLMLRKDMFDQQAADVFAQTYKTLVMTFAKDQDICLGDAFTI